MGYNNVPVNGWPQIKDLEKLDALAKQIEDMPVYTSDDRAFLDTWERDLPILAQDVSDLNTTKANQITIAPTFNAETAYEVGDLVYYNGLSYRCTNSHEGDWDADDFAATTINNELSALNSKLNGLPKYAKVNVTIPTTVSTISDLVPMPSGFTKTNCFIVNAYCDPNVAERYTIATLQAEGIQIFFTNNNVQLSTLATAVAGWLGKTVTVILQTTPD